MEPDQPRRRWMGGGRVMRAPGADGRGPSGSRRPHSSPCISAVAVSGLHLRCCLGSHPEFLMHGFVGTKRVSCGDFLFPFPHFVLNLCY